MGPRFTKTKKSPRGGLHKKSIFLRLGQCRHNPNFCFLNGSVAAEVAIETFTTTFGK
jgi:hypothetical protein